MWEAERWILRCRGIPFKATKSELEAWFDTSQLSGPLEESVHITYNDEGKCKGGCHLMYIKRVGCTVQGCHVLCQRSLVYFQSGVDNAIFVTFDSPQSYQLFNNSIKILP